MTAATPTHTTTVRVLTRSDVESVLDLPSCIDAVDAALRAAAAGHARSGVLGMHAADGGFHAKAALLEQNDDAPATWFVAKLNANFPANPSRYGLPTIQGVLALFDGRDGRLLALMDSSALTIIRTAAATGVAARRFARPDATSLAIIGCGAQAFAQVSAVAAVRPIRKVLTADTNTTAANHLAARLRDTLGLTATARDVSKRAPYEADVVITCTPSRTPILAKGDVLSGTFISAVGADNEDKSEIEPVLMRDAAVVVDSLAQAATIGDLHHAIAAGVMTQHDVLGELGALLGDPPAIEYDPRRIVVFDSTGVAVEDVAAAVVAFKRAQDADIGRALDLTA